MFRPDFTRDVQSVPTGAGTPPFLIRTQNLSRLNEAGSVLYPDGPLALDVVLLPPADWAGEVSDMEIALGVLAAVRPHGASS